MQCLFSFSFFFYTYVYLVHEIILSCHFSSIILCVKYELLWKYIKKGISVEIKTEHRNGYVVKLSLMFPQEDILQDMF